MHSVTLCCAPVGHDYQDVLLNDIDAACLPDWLGGCCRCESTGGCVPEIDEDSGTDSGAIVHATAKGCIDHGAVCNCISKF